jgi:hypothetical protein
VTSQKTDFFQNISKTIDKAVSIILFNIILREKYLNFQQISIEYLNVIGQRGDRKAEFKTPSSEFETFGWTQA